MFNPFFNAAQITNTAKAAVQSFLTGAMQDFAKQGISKFFIRYPKVKDTLLQLYLNPHATLSSMCQSPADKQYLDSLMSGKSVKEQQDILLDDIKANGIDLRLLAAKFGINL